VAAIADALGLGRFAVLGHSGGGPHALACAALLPARVTAAVSVSAPAPFDADGLDWFAGWSWLAGVDGQAIEQGNEGYLEDTLAAVRPWGFRPDAIEVPALIMHGARDKMVPPRARRLARGPLSGCGIAGRPRRGSHHRARQRPGGAGLARRAVLARVRS